LDVSTSRDSGPNMLRIAPRSARSAPDLAGFELRSGRRSTRVRLDWILAPKRALVLVQIHRSSGLVATGAAPARISCESIPERLASAESGANPSRIWPDLSRYPTSEECPSKVDERQILLGVGSDSGRNQPQIQPPSAHWRHRRSLRSDLAGFVAKFRRIAPGKVRSGPDLAGWEVRFGS
jgi:hypothetical protein